VLIVALFAFIFMMMLVFVLPFSSIKLTMMTDSPIMMKSGMMGALGGRRSYTILVNFGPLSRGAKFSIADISDISCRITIKFCIFTEWQHDKENFSVKNADFPTRWLPCP